MQTLTLIDNISRLASGACVAHSTGLITYRKRRGTLSAILSKPRQIAASLIVCCLLLSTIAFGQGQDSVNTASNPSQTVVKRNIIRLSFFDRSPSSRKNKPRRHVHVNGLNLSMASNVTVMNGIDVGLLLAADSICNGIQIGGLASSAYGRINGIAFGGIAIGAKTINGIAFAPIAGAGKINGLGINLMRIPDTLNGCFFGFWGDFSKNDEGFGNAKGSIVNVCVTRLATLSGLNISGLAFIDHLKGLSVGVFNQIGVLEGVQVGLWNVATNKKHLKALPLVNCNFRKTRTATGQEAGAGS